MVDKEDDMAVGVQHWDAFTRLAGKGNPAGIVLAAQDFSDSDMQAIASAVGFNDTAFVLSSNTADLRIRYFGRSREVDLCGHATIAAFAALHHRCLLPPDKIDGIYMLETKSGVLPISIDLTDDHSPLVVMTQGVAQFAPFNGSRDRLARVLGIAATDFHATLPIVYGSTGRWTLVVPARDLATMQRMCPKPDEFVATLADRPDASIHPFCFETINPEAVVHARHFSSPTSGTLEDAVTGTASGVLGAYYRRFVAQTVDGTPPWVIEQGYEVGREGSVKVWVSQEGENYTVKIAGSACFIRDIKIDRP